MAPGMTIRTKIAKAIVMDTRVIAVLAVVGLVPLLLVSCASTGVEKPKYKVLIKEGNFEIRQYEPYIVAETSVDASFEEAGNMAFRRLFDYISGNNRKKESIAMTAPVNQARESEKIAMTAPVNQWSVQGEYSVSFVMPSKYRMETLPEPLSPDVVLREVSARKAAAIRYSGTWSKKRYDARKDLLEQFLEARGLTAVDEPTFARYDPPFQIPFLRRNEVLIPVE
jgi:hypothetical protein